MAEITVRALDSALAMEEVQKKLGDDALIISTKRVDGKIEITATDDDIVLHKNKDEPLVLGDLYRQDQFSSLLDKKMKQADAGQDLKVSDEFYSILKNKLITVTEEISNVKSLIENFDFNEPSEIGTLDKLRFIGFRKSTLKKFPELSEKTDLSIAVRKLAKSFVNGKCTHFDTSDIFIICGSKSSGKTTFVKKFAKLQADLNEDRVYHTISNQNKRKLFSAVKGLVVSNDQGQDTKRHCLVVDINDNDIDPDILIAEINKERSDAKVSVVHTIPVGKSFEFLKKQHKFSTIPNYYIAFTKLDICDLSVPEISAVVELPSKCMFFSGIEKAEDGAYFAKLDQIEAYLLKKIREDVG